MSQESQATPTYRSSIDPIWCPGCGDYGVLKAVEDTLTELAVPPEDVIAVSGIGCSGRLPHFLNVYALHGTHGRALPTAIGAKVARIRNRLGLVGKDDRHRGFAAIGQASS